MGYVFSAFGPAYAVFEIPGGIYCDRKGPRKALTRVVIWWSVFTMATGWARGLVSLWTVRFLFGAGEAGCYPALARVFQVWLPQRERAVAEGLKTASSRLGAAMAPYLVVMLAGSFHWRGAFLVLGSLGFWWAGAFYWWFRDFPEEHPSVNAAELALLPQAQRAPNHRPVPWGHLLGSPSLWLLGLQWFCHFYAFYFYITWLPTYLQQVGGVDVRRSAVLAGLPVLTAAAGSLAGGWVLAHLIGRLGDIRRARKLTAYFSFTTAALVMMLAIRAGAAETTVWLMSLSSFFAECSAPLTWTTAMDLGGRHVGAASGLMNTMGQCGGAVAPV